MASAYSALVLGTRDYVHKCGFRRVVLGLSGGIDSALTACVAVDALGRENVMGVGMPSAYSSQGSIDDAAELARNLGIHFELVPIAGMFDAYNQALGPVFAGRAADVTEENIQARIRGSLLMAISNKFGSLLLTTGNKSELGVGYCTLYGDMCGGLAVISDVPKTLVYQLARYVNDAWADDSAIDDRQAAVGRTAARPERQRLVAGLRGSGQHSPGLRGGESRACRHCRSAWL